MNKEIHELLKVKNDETTIFTNKELKMIDDYIKELEAYKYNMDRDYLRLEEENKQLYKTIEELSQYEYDRKEDYFKYYIQGSDHYLIPKDVFDELFNELKQLQQENQELKKENKILRENAEHNDKVVDKVNWENQKLKKELEEANEKILLLQVSEPMLEYKKTLEKNQQKEFIEWLTNEANINPYDISDYDYEKIINTILSKYKEIIGGKDEI